MDSSGKSNEKMQNALRKLGEIFGSQNVFEDYEGINIEASMSGQNSIRGIQYLRNVANDLGITIFITLPASQELIKELDKQPNANILIPFQNNDMDKCYKAIDLFYDYTHHMLSDLHSSRMHDPAKTMTSLTAVSWQQNARTKLDEDTVGASKKFTPELVEQQISTIAGYTHQAGVADKEAKDWLGYLKERAEKNNQPLTTDIPNTWLNESGMKRLSRLSCIQRDDIQRKFRG